MLFIGYIHFGTIIHSSCSLIDEICVFRVSIRLIKVDRLKRIFYFLFPSSKSIKYEELFKRFREFGKNVQFVQFLFPSHPLHNARIASISNKNVQRIQTTGNFYRHTNICAIPISHNTPATLYFNES